MTTPDDLTAIHATLQRYATCLDDFDFTGVGGVFTDDADVVYGGHPPMSGGVDTATFLQQHTAGTGWQQHLVSVVDVQVDGDFASTVSYFIAHAVPRADADSVRINVGEYRDRLRRTAQGWQICERRQHTGWKEQRRRLPM